MNGAHALLATLTANDVNVCFANPGTSEMHFVAALDDAPEMRAILCLFEGVATGAADGYARVKGSPASTLLHLGPGLANGWANLHNARRARVPVVNVVGDHATYHAIYDAPLQSNIEALALGLEGWYRRTTSSDELVRDATEAIAAACSQPSRVATLVLPADISWGDVTAPPSSWPFATREAPLDIDEGTFARALHALKTKRCALLVGGHALSKEQLGLAYAVANATSAKFVMETFPTIMDRGRGVASPERLIYLSEFAVDQLKDAEALILLGAREPVGFFAYPNVASRLVPEDCEVIDLAPPGSNTLQALRLFVDALKPSAVKTYGSGAERPTGELTTHTFAQAIGATMKEGVIVADESNTSGVHLFNATDQAPEHQWMTLTGGAIGYGLPVALGAAVASGRRVLALESDGSMMYTLQALWTMARESLDVTVVGLSNQSYAILNMELTRVGAVREGAQSARMLELDNPTLNLAALASAQGVPSTRVTTADELVSALERSYATPGPMFIDTVLPKGLH